MWVFVVVGLIILIGLDVIIWSMVELLWVGLMFVIENPSCRMDFENNYATLLTCLSLSVLAAWGELRFCEFMLESDKMMVSVSFFYLIMYSAVFCNLAFWAAIVPVLGIFFLLHPLPATVYTIHEYYFFLFFVRYRVITTCASWWQERSFLTL